MVMWRVRWAERNRVVACCVQLQEDPNILMLTTKVALAIVGELCGASVVRLRLKRESGENPELPRSGKQERTLHLWHWPIGWEAGAK
jgi:hypothetical protein